MTGARAVWLNSCFASMRSAVRRGGETCALTPRRRGEARSAESAAVRMQGRGGSALLLHFCMRAVSFIAYGFHVRTVSCAM